MTIDRLDAAYLLANAREVARLLTSRRGGTSLRIRIPAKTFLAGTDGWNATIGRLGTRGPNLDLWLDKFSGHPERKFWAGFHSETRRPLKSITKLVVNNFTPVRVVRDDDLIGGQFDALLRRIRRTEFNLPILEEYSGGRTYFGIYDPTNETSQGIDLNFCSQAAAFFEAVARSVPDAAPSDEQTEVYPQIENRKRVEMHIRRERSRLLSEQRKILDKYVCQACGLRMEDVYGSDLGERVADAHHLVPLSLLQSGVMTVLDDLRTVCPNCHRILHKMDGEGDDIDKLRAILKGRRE